MECIDIKKIVFRLVICVLKLHLFGKLDDTLKAQLEQDYISLLDEVGDIDEWW